ncbi:class I SAM-dependent methyltransferase [Thiococcus pfennigii]|jgi:SAM-dependent methyltransferase|uniref:class I SAM-dependent methyltransferase n=1 Tax=Thiococcus pfennigii TaxID=1057 RepID=UPI001905C5B9|nr:class I SAM-dependent methyltransferase [Thiococcus pfennigii]MBK1702319.1 SAM-dependent methyltransferase [Thiococcus pfennigii]
MKRRPEPELMDEAEQARAYALEDFSEPNARFIELLREFATAPIDDVQALDLGCGPADIVIRFLRARPRARCDALDGSAAMLEHARAALAKLPGVAQRCRLICDRLPSPQLPRGHYDLILSNSLLHHLHDPQVLWRTLAEVGKPGAQVLVMDLMRPASAAWVEALVETYAGGSPEVLRRDFRNSLCAAFEPREVVEQLAEAGLSGLEVAVVSDRHLAVHGRLPGA